MLKRSIQGLSSTNCMLLVPVSNPVISGTVTRNPAIAPTSATMRPSRGWRSPPAASTITPATMGTQTERLSQWVALSKMFLALRSAGIEDAVQPQREDQEHADDHAERIVIDVPRLDPAHDAGDPADDARRAVHHDAVDQGDVAVSPERCSEVACPAGESPVIEPVE